MARFGVRSGSLGFLARPETVETSGLSARTRIGANVARSCHEKVVGSKPVIRSKSPANEQVPSSNQETMAAAWLHSSSVSPAARRTEAAHAREFLAEPHLAIGERDSAKLELQAARAAFDRLGARLDTGPAVPSRDERRRVARDQSERTEDQNGCTGCTRPSLTFAAIRSRDPRPLQTGS
jgi:hypothetical protein